MHRSLPPDANLPLLAEAGLAAVVVRVVDEGADFVIDEVNAECERVEAETSEALVGRSLLARAVAPERAPVLRSLLTAWKQGEAVDLPGPLLSAHTPAAHRSRVVPLGGNRLLALYRDRSAELEADTTRETHRLLADSVVDGVWDWNLTRDTLYLSPSWKAHLGYADDELANSFETFAELLHPSDVGRVMSEVTACRSSDQQAWASEFRLRHRRGHFRWILARGSIVRDTTGDVTRMVGVHIDIDARRRAEAERDAAREEQRLLAEVVSTTDDLMSFVDRQFVYRVVNDAYLANHGKRREDLVGRHVADVLGVEVFEGVVRENLERCFHGEVVRYQSPFTYVGGITRHMHVQYTPSIGNDGTISGAVVTVRDITDLHEAEERNRQAAEVFRSTSNGVIITTLDGTILDVNDAFTTVTGYTREEAIGNNPRLLSSGRHDAEFYEGMFEACRAQGSWSGEIWNRRKNGEVYPESITISVVRTTDGDPNGYIAVFSDITEVKETALRMERLATHDALTQLPNRRKLHERLARSLARARRNQRGVAVTFLDLDSFKLVNDGLGHRVGDRLLQVIAERLRSVARQGDTVGRLSGDEFIGVFEHIDTATQASRVVQRLMHSFQQPVELEGHVLHPTCSVGVALFPADGDTADELLSHADAAMYAAKEAGRNTYAFYTEEMTAQVREDMMLANALRGALREGRLTLAYQPQIALGTGAVIGVEALARWAHPTLGSVPPARFIRVAEQTGLMVELGAWVLDEACRQAKAWRADGVDFGRVAVNISAQQIAHPDFVDAVYGALARHRIPAGLLQLELTETTMMTRLTEQSARLDALHAMGVSLAIDDFGTGYSSIAYLKQLPIDSLKLDKSFVRDLPDDPDDRAIADAVVGMGRALGVSVTAEGVETHAQRRFLEEIGCQVVQGYLYSRPVPASDLPAALMQRGEAED